jgi:hypothetical protein
MNHRLLLTVIVLAALALAPQRTQAETPAGFVSLFDGKTFAGWNVPEGDNGHWKIVDGVIDYDAASESSGDKSLWTAKKYGDFVLTVDWRIKETPYINPGVPIIKPDGTHKLGADGKEIRMAVPDSDSGILLRDTGKSQVNIWCWPIGSGEVYGYRNKAVDPVIRAGVTPSLKADNPIGEWNTFHITMKGDRLTVKLNGHLIIENAQLPEVPEKGGIALQHHGGKKPDGEFSPASSLVQFRNIAIKKLD